MCKDIRTTQLLLQRYNCNATVINYPWDEAAVWAAEGLGTKLDSEKKRLRIAGSHDSNPLVITSFTIAEAASDLFSSALVLSVATLAKRLVGETTGYHEKLSELNYLYRSCEHSWAHDESILVVSH